MLKIIENALNSAKVTGFIYNMVFDICKIISNMGINLDTINTIILLIIYFAIFLDYIRKIRLCNKFNISLKYFSLDWKQVIYLFYEASKLVMSFILLYIFILFLFKSGNLFTLDEVALRIVFISNNILVYLVVIIGVNAYVHDNNKEIPLLINIFISVLWIIFVIFVGINYVNKSGTFKNDIYFEIYNTMVLVEIVIIIIFSFREFFVIRYEIIKNNKTNNMYVVISQSNGIFILKKIYSCKIINRIRYYTFDLKDNYCIKSNIDNYSMINTNARVVSISSFNKLIKKDFKAKSKRDN